ncbi:PD-(D/E)XK motif protein [Eubacterium barkeri]|uniref:Putative PD-(D/E)XK family member n=1 Tax=Eubacterium barkeri TaxID=1528 RepID=A0A1H3JTS8_EUBBA|nr:PD-(D/E)XK motif protein [Eubacterium barkeri]SDY43326.1 Putative PD-(D/E)XK family member [Eubacterium barkeri]
MKSDLESKFKIGKDNNTFQRISAECPHDIFAGYNMGKAILCIKGKGQYCEIRSTRIIRTIFTGRENHCFELCFVLNEDTYFRQFLKLCTDIIERATIETEQKLLINVLNTWSCWLELFKGERSPYLNDNQIKGLVAELLFLNQYLIPKIGGDAAITAWMGPEKNHKDIETGERWCEIKAVSTGALTVKISSLEQLDSDIYGYLVIFYLDKSNQTRDNQINLNKCVKSIEMKLEAIETQFLFKRKLLKAGYFEDVYYDTICFLHKKTSFYRVTDGFPVILKKDIATGIVRVAYDIMIEALVEYQIQGN